MSTDERNSPVEELLREAGPREELDPEVLAEIDRSVRAEWRRQVGVGEEAPAQRGWPAVLALAATLLLSLAAALWWIGALRGGTSDAPLATVAAITGSGALLDGDDTVALGAEIVPGSRLATSDGRVALLLTTGQSVRLDAQSEVVMRATDELELIRGAVYVDSNAVGASLAVQTTFGRAVDVGTQFEVRLHEDAVQVRVREGEVRLSRDEGAVRSATAGGALRLDGAGHFESGSTALGGPEWAWVLAVAPRFGQQAPTGEALLAWYAREHGLELVFADQRARDLARQRLNLLPEGVMLDDALELVESGRLRLRVDADRLVVEALQFP